MLFGFAAIIAAIGLIALSVIIDRSDREAFARSQGFALASASAAALAPALIAKDWTNVDNALARLRDQSGVVSVKVYAADGTLLAPTNAQYANTAINRSLNQGAQTGQPSVAIQNGLMRTTIPVHGEGRLNAFFEHTYNFKLNQPGLLTLIGNNSWKGLILLGLALPAGLLVFLRLMAPLAGLNRAAAEAAAGDLSVRLEVTSHDELGVLANSFNTMLDRLKTNLDRTRWLAYGDNLTRLANKTAFSERLRQSVAPGQAPGALMLIDLDGFKRFNDAYGQEEGDRILKIIAQRLHGVSQAHAPTFALSAGKSRPLLARLSGNEFGILVPGACSAPEIQTLATDILEAIAAPINLCGHNANLSARIGIALYPHDAGDANTLLTSVNFAIDEAKKAGGGTYCFFEPAMSQKAIRRMTLQNELRRALRDNEFLVHYQPKVDVREGTIAGCEALVRWQQPSGKLVGPGLFIETAEETGLIQEIGDFVLEESCRAAARWEKAGFSCGVAVNVSALQFANDDFTNTVFNALKKAGLPPSKLELELTESVAMTNPERMMEQIGPLRDQGVRFAIDDFGTGHSSLAYLTRLPFDVFKIDQSFVQTMNEDKHARVIVQTVLAMAESLGYRTVAEGVETREHFAFLQLHCCDYVQGYYFARPMPEDELIAMLQSEQDNLVRSQPSALVGVG